jgi:hypothetical protein
MGPESKVRARGAGYKGLFIVVVAVLVTLNFVTLVVAYPETGVIDAGCCAGSQVLAKDFSAYYTAAWRLIHDPAQIYFHGFVNDGEFPIAPQPEGYKYLPSFLLMVSPLLALPYGDALLAFDAFQFLLLPLIALLIYELLKDRGLVVSVAVAVGVLLLPLPLPTPQWSISVSYYWQWAEGQSKVLETFLLLSSLCLAKYGRPRLAGVAYALASFDPRFALLAIPLFAAYSTKFRLSFLYALGTFVLVNVPLLYPPTAAGFLGMVFSSGLMTPPYYYTFIPILALASLMIVEHERVGLRMKAFISWSSSILPWSKAEG